MEKNHILKIAIVGAESTGKTELCDALASHFNTSWVPEYARVYFNDSDIYNYTLDDLEQISTKQIEMENTAIKSSNQFLFCDTAIITLKIWAELEFGFCPDLILKQLKENKYDYYLITNNEITWKEDKLRLNKFDRELIFNLNREETLKTKLPFGIVSGIGEDRVQNAIRQINWSFMH